MIYQDFSCPKCGHKDFQKDGRDKKTRKRMYVCKHCKSKSNEDNLTGSPQIVGVTASERTDFKRDILPYLKMIGKKATEKNIVESSQVINMPNRPFAIALLSDIHGGGKTDYEKLESDLEIIRATEDMYVGNLGDNTDNFVVSKLQSIQREQPTTFDMEFRFLEWLIDMVKDSLVFWVSGNHDNWTKKVSGFDFIRHSLSNVPCLYDPHEIRFTLKWGDNEQRWMVRHKWRNSSIFNPTHPIEVGWERVGYNFDVGCGGHTHIATLCREFIREGAKRYAVLLGTYKIRDNFAREIGFAKNYGSGSGAFVYHPDGRVFWCDDLVTAQRLLNSYR